MLDHIVQVLCRLQSCLRFVANLCNFSSGLNLEVQVDFGSLLDFRALLFKWAFTFLLRLSCIQEVVELGVEFGIFAQTGESSCLLDQEVLSQSLKALLNGASGRFGQRNCREV